MKLGTIGEATITISASPEAVYDLVTDVTRMGEWSPETARGEWLDGATSPAVGARFKGSNKRGVMRWSTTPTVLAAERGRLFSFVTYMRGNEATKWSYALEPAGEGTKVTESFELMRDTPKVILLVDRFLLRIPDRHADLVRGMQTTLERLKRVAECA